MRIKSAESKIKFGEDPWGVSRRGPVNLHGFLCSPNPYLNKYINKNSPVGGGNREKVINHRRVTVLLIPSVVLHS
jgi:hypothetical protein